MQTLQKPKGFSLDRLLNDPVAMFGALGAMGALVLTVWFVAGRNAPRDEEASGGGFAAHSAGAAKPAAAVAGSNLGVAKLKGKASAGALPEVLKDAGSSASASADGTVTGTMAEIAAAQKAEDEKAAGEAAAKRKAIPVESSGRGHVPGMAVDSTKLAAAGQGGFGAPGGLSNSDFSAAAGGAASAAAPAGSGGSAPVLDGRVAPASELGEGGPLASAAAGGGRQAVAGSRPFARSQTAGGNGPAASAASARRATGGIAGGGTAGLPLGAGGPGFSDGSATFSRPASGGGTSAESAMAGGGSERMASAGGGAPAFAGGVGSGRGALALSGGEGASESSAKATTVASKKELTDQAAKHLETAQSYRGSVVLPLAKREKSNALFLEGRLIAASAILGSLDRQLAIEQGVFKASPAAKEALANSRAMINGGKDSLKARVDSSAADMAAGAVSIMSIPDKCDFRPILKENVFHAWNPFNHPGYKGRMVVVDGQRGYYTEEETTLDLHGVATKGQDLLEGAARRASNVSKESASGIRLVDPEFGPAIDALKVPDPKGAARLASVAGRIKDDLGRVSSVLPDQVTDSVSIGTQAQGDLQKSTEKGYGDVQGLARKVGERRLGYPDSTERDALDRSMGNATRASGQALSAVNSLQGTGADSMFVLTEASRASTYAMIDLCHSHDHLKALAGKAK
ncbi:MAG: hypothetical protein HY928_13195 [Elusimicrobia bacterium]|nr:hypothetical protein [Elusimicrobiota bacterium]